MGSDVYKEGVKGWGSSKINLILQQIKNGLSCADTDLEAMLLNGLKRKVVDSMIGANMDVVETLVSAFLYEPAIVVNEETINNSNNEESNHPYIFDPPPATLPKYLAAFRHGNVRVENERGADVCHCKGFSGSGGCEHSFLSFEGSYSCTMCKNIFCRTCSFVPEKDKGTMKNKEEKIYYRECNQVFCLYCFRSHRLGDNSNNNAGSNNGDRR